MRYLTILLFSCLPAILSCSKPAQNSASGTATATTSETTKIEPASTTSTTECPGYFYYYNAEKISLKVKPHFLVVSFQPDLTTEAKTRILKQFPEYEMATQQQTTDVTPFQIVKLRSGTTCAQAMPILAKLNETPEVLYANPVFNAPTAMGGGTAWIGLTSEFLVNIKSAANAAELKALATKTKTKVVEEIGETTFLLQATKTSQGNALEMANLFHDEPFVTSAEPDFYVAAESGGLKKN